MSQAIVLEEIRVERERQDDLWGVEFDDQNTLNDWVTRIVICAGKAARMDSLPKKQRDKMLKVAALATAAVESFDRNGEFAPRHFEKGESQKDSVQPIHTLLHDEIAIIRTAIERLTDGIKTHEDLIQRSTSLSVLMLTMERLVRTTTVLEFKMV